MRHTALLEASIWAVVIALILGAFGPSLDAPTRSYASYGYTPAQRTEHRALDLEAQRACERDRGENAGVIYRTDGAIVCTDKHGRRGRSQVTIAVKTDRSWP